MPRVETVADQLALGGPSVDVRAALGRRHYERFVADAGLTGSTHTWPALTKAQQDAWAARTDYLVDVVEELVADAALERRQRAQWAVGFIDRTLAAQEDADTVTDDMCQHAPGPWTCTRPAGHERPHVAGDGCVHIAAWGEIP